MKLSDEQKQTILGRLREGWCRLCAATEVGATGTQLRRACKESCASFDYEFALAYHDAITEAGDIPCTHPEHKQQDNWRTPLPRRETTAMGFTKAAFLSEEQLQGFLDRVRGGEPRDIAAREVGTSLLQIDRRARREPALAQAMKEAYRIGYPNFQQKLEGRAYEYAMNGNWQALRDLLVIHWPERYAALRTSRHELGGIGGGPLQMLMAEVFPKLPAAELDRLIKHLETEEQRALPA